MISLTAPFAAPYDDRHQWREGDVIAALDGRPVEDMLDFYYYVPEGREMVLTIQRASGQTCEVRLPAAALGEVTESFAPMEFKTCACKCVFCFIDQNPKKMRAPIYVKDEDYRFSFLYGNYITLTSLGRKGLERVIRQKMSPLFVSVHATDIDVRTRMLGIKRRVDVVQILRALVDNGITVHTQIVLCPGWNDGPILEKSYRDLVELFPGVGSIAVVPVGLTAHRDSLTRLDPVTPALAKEVIGQVADFQGEAHRRTGHSFIHLSDEFYLLAGTDFPPLASYGDLPQVDNGIGLTVHLRDRWREDLSAAAAAGNLPRRPLTILTGRCAQLAFEREFLPEFARHGTAPVKVVGVENRFYGASVTVAGLLAGQDIRRALLSLPADPVRMVLLSSRIFNSDGLTLDDMDLATLVADSPHSVMVAPEEGFVDFWKGLD